MKTWAAYGVDCWYFDTLPFGYGFSPVCYNTGHGHARPLNMSPGILEIMRRTQRAMDRGEAAAIANECISDIVAIYGTHALGNELQGWCQPPKPEIWRYTFPEYLVFTGHCNGLCLSAYPGYDDLDSAKKGFPDNMYAVRNLEHAYNRVFLLGDRFDLLNTFIWREGKNEQAAMSYAEKILALRRRTKAHQYASDFKDDVGLSIEPRDVKVEARLFRHRQDKSFTITLLDRRKEKGDVALTLDLEQYSRPKIGKVALFTLDGKEAGDCRRGCRRQNEVGDSAAAGRRGVPAHFDSVNWQGAGRHDRRALSTDEFSESSHLRIFGFRWFMAARLIGGY